MLKDILFVDPIAVVSLQTDIIQMKAVWFEQTEIHTIPLSHLHKNLEIYYEGDWLYILTEYGS